MVFNATFNTISVILWRSVLLVEETGVSRENHRPVASHSQTVSHNVVSSTPRLCYFSSSLSQNCVSTILTTTMKITNYQSDS